MNRELRADRYYFCRREKAAQIFACITRHPNRTWERYCVHPERQVQPSDEEADEPLLSEYVAIRSPRRSLVHVQQTFVLIQPDFC